MGFFGYQHQRSTTNADSLTSVSPGQSMYGGNHGALSLCAVYACIKAIAESGACLPLEIKTLDDDGNVVTVKDHPLTQLLAKPNGYQTRSQLVKYLLSSICLRGNAYAVIGWKNGQIDSLSPLHPDFVLPYWSKGRVWYDCIIDHKRQVLYGDEILHFRGDYFATGANGGLLGLAPLDTCVNAVGISLGADTFANGFFKSEPLFLAW